MSVDICESELSDFKYCYGIRNDEIVTDLCSSFYLCIYFDESGSIGFWKPVFALSAFLKSSSGLALDLFLLNLEKLSFLGLFKDDGLANAEMLLLLPVLAKSLDFRL